MINKKTIYYAIHGLKPIKLLQKKRNRNMMRLFLLSGLLVFGAFSFSSAQSFQLRCNGNPIQVNEQNDVPLSYGLNTYKYARVTYGGNPLTLEVTASGFEFSNADWDISPHSYGIKVSRKGNKLSFTIDRVGYLVLRFSLDQDFTKRLVIFVEAPEKLPEGELVDIVKRYQVDNTGSSNETKKIQQALNDISGSGKVLYFPEGVYKSFMIKIKRNSTIHLVKNARIIADASNLDSYMALDGVGINRFILIAYAKYSCYRVRYF
jgi:hypothetical protein